MVATFSRQENNERSTKVSLLSLLLLRLDEEFRGGFDLLDPGRPAGTHAAEGLIWVGDTHSVNQEREKKQNNLSLMLSALSV